MTKIFACAQVSTSDPTTDKQPIEIQSAGFEVKPHRIIVESISGSMADVECPGFAKLLNKLEQDEYSSSRSWTALSGTRRTFAPYLTEIARKCR